MVKKAAILLGSFPSAVFPQEWQPSDWSEIVRNGKGYKVIASFEQYFTPAVASQFDFIGTVEEFDAWLEADPLKRKKEDMEFTTNLRLEMLVGQSETELDANTYQQVSEAFKFVEAAALRGDVVQLKRQINLLPIMPPLWTEQVRSYFVAKIDQYLGI